MLTGKQNLGAESYERCNKRKFCCIGDNMDDYILNLRLAVLFSLSLFFFFHPSSKCFSNFGISAFIDYLQLCLESFV